MDIIKCVIRGQKLSVNIPFMVDLTINYFNVSADFDSEWDDYQQRWVYITKHDDSSVGGSFLLNEDNKVPDTSSINLNGGQWDVWFLGVSGDRYGVDSRITTEVKTFRVAESGQYEAVMPTIPQSNVEQITALAMDAFNDSQYAKVTADEAKEIAQDVMDMAEGGELDGATFTPSVSAAGVISWTNNKELPNPASVNIKGPKGDTGDTGPVGATPNMTIGSVLTVPAGGIASASISGTAEQPVLNLNIPRGDPGEVSESEFEPVKELVDMTIEGVYETSPNLLNPANITSGYTYKIKAAADSPDNRAHVEIVETTGFNCAFIDVVSGNSYVCTGISYNAFTGDADGFALGRAYTASTSTPNVVFDTTNRTSSYNNADKTITRVYFSWRETTYPKASFMVNEGTTLLPYEPYGDTLVSTKLNEDVKIPGEQIVGELGETYTVDINGGGDYTSWTACIRALANDENKKTIYVKAGTYDIFDEIGGQAYCESITGQGLTWFDVADIIPPHTTVIGLGEVVFQFTPTVDQIPSDVASLLSPINVIYDIHMENISIVCTNCRYGIHDETGHIDTVVETRHIYRNVRIDHTYVDRGMKPAFGCGFNRSQYFEFDGCIFKSSDRAWSFHNKGTSANEVDNTIIVIKNSAAVVDNGQRSLRFGNVNGYQVRIDTRVFNTYLSSKIWIGDESSTQRPNAFALTVVGCGNPTFQILSTTNIYTPVVYQI